MKKTFDIVLMVFGVVAAIATVYSAFTGTQISTVNMLLVLNTALLLKLLWRK